MGDVIKVFAVNAAAVMGFAAGVAVVCITHKKLKEKGLI